MGSASLGRFKPATVWLGWLAGTAAFAAVVLAVTHLSEEEEFVHLVQTAEPAWLILALLLQTCTYAAQGTVWRSVTRSAGCGLSLWQAFRISLAMLFVDQALPSGGLSGVAVVSGSLQSAGVPKPIVISAVMMDIAMYYLAYATCLAVGLGIACWQGHLPGWITLAGLGFVIVGFGTSWLALRLPTGGMTSLRRWVGRLPRLNRMLAWIDQADPAPWRSRRVPSQALAAHGAIFLLDAATVWVALRAVGVAAPPTGVFGSFMIASLFRTIGFMPGGLGTFEAASVYTLKLIGLPLSAGLSATLLFRGLSFWLPMVPGLVISREIVASSSRPSTTSNR